MTIPPPYVLVHTNNYGERHYFVALGDKPWPQHPERRLIDATTRDKIKARVFDTLPEALAVLVQAGNPPGWAEEAVV